MGDRKSHEVEGYSHGDNPIPAVSRVKNMVASGGISGIDLSSQTMPSTIEAQCSNMFALMARVAAAGGATLADILKLTVYLKPDQSRDALNAEWIKAFPDHHSRPVRHVIVNDRLGGGMLVQCEFLAVV